MYRTVEECLLEASATGWGTGFYTVQPTHPRPALQWWKPLQCTHLTTHDFLHVSDCFRDYSNLCRNCFGALLNGILSGRVVPYCLHLQHAHYLLCHETIGKVFFWWFSVAFKWCHPIYVKKWKPRFSSGDVWMWNLYIECQNDTKSVEHYARHDQEIYDAEYLVTKVVDIVDSEEMTMGGSRRMDEKWTKWLPKK